MFSATSVGNCASHPRAMPGPGHFSQRGNPGIRPIDETIRVFRTALSTPGRAYRRARRHGKKIGPQRQIASKRLRSTTSGRLGSSLRAPRGYCAFGSSANSFLYSLRSECRMQPELLRGSDLDDARTTACPPRRHRDGTRRYRGRCPASVPAR